MKLSTLALLAFAPLALYLVTPAGAQTLPYTLTHNVSDTNGDGVPDPAVRFYGGYACGCYCPVTTTTLHIEAAGQSADARDVDGCGQTDYGAGVTSGQINPTATPVVQYSSTCSGGNCPQ